MTPTATLSVATVCCASLALIGLVGSGGADSSTSDRGGSSFGKQFAILGSVFGFRLCNWYSNSPCEQKNEREDDGA